MDKNFFETNPTLKKIFNHMDDAVYFIDSFGAILFMNKAAEKLDGYKLSEIRGRTVMEMYGLDATQSPLLRVAANIEPIHDHTFRYYVNNKEVYQVCNTLPIELEDGTWGAFSIQKDVTKLKKTIEHNIELQKKLFDYKDKTGKKNHSEGNLYTFDDIIGDHKLLVDCKNLANNAAQSDSPILLSGLTGTGKELFAQSIHSASKRKNGTFLAINCAAIPETLLEGILFGTEKGIYTGATERKGLFEQANGGTLFLDEINSMPLSSQSKLLRVLEEKYVQPLGSKEKIRIDTRIISSCNEYPKDAVEKKQIRQDLFYRLAVINILIPPLIDRKSDIFLLSHHFIAYYNEIYKKNILAMDDDITTFFLDFDWPGNVRQLRYCIECAMNLVDAKETTIKEKHLPFYLRENKEDVKRKFYQEFQSLETEKSGTTIRKRERKPMGYTAPKPHTELSEIFTDNEDSEETPMATQAISQGENVFSSIRQKEKDRIIAALIKHDGVISKAAKEMGISRQTFVYRMKKHNIK
ncbi:MAG: sigma 54-interacting transcriptional regulator [Clostridiales bacterium]